MKKDSFLKFFAGSIWNKAVIVITIGIGILAIASNSHFPQYKSGAYIGAACMGFVSIVNLVGSYRAWRRVSNTKSQGDDNAAKG